MTFQHIRKTNKLIPWMFVSSIFNDAVFSNLNHTASNKRLVNE
jgi:hypothetical protein